MEHVQTRITSTASATTSYPYLSMCANCDFSENIAWVFGVNRVFRAFLIYPIYPKNPKYYLFVFSSPFKQPIRITDSFSFDYADSPYHLITSSPPSYGLPADTFLAHLKSPQELLPTSFLPENQYSILNYVDGGSGACDGNFPPFRHIFFRVPQVKQ
jgi:hypothetical protein